MLQNLTSKELNSLLNDCSSVEKEIKLPDGKRKYIFKKRAILDFQGKPVSLDKYMHLSGERIMIENTPKEKKSLEERKEIKKAITNFKKKGHVVGFTTKLFNSRWLRLKLIEIVES